MKHLTDDIVKLLRSAAATSDSQPDQLLLQLAARRLEQLTMPDDATFARIVDAMYASLKHEGILINDRCLRNAYRAAVKAIES
jgi:hypothetical protein